ncbi:MAG: asparagine synthase (glutamine-hydrolyzing) [Gemmatimonadetes bacterium]|nr:asparagine synthase (glutamine-hydrolyzing) [Gemmatimonadota bacterium]
MCGIAGFASIAPGGAVDRAPISSMLSCLRHRGPDDEGVFVGDGIVLGHRRLSVIDLEGGRQPMAGSLPSIRVIANGEIYNYRELRAELEDVGHRFRTRSDIEVVAQAYERWGLTFLDHLEGMFALALWDARSRRLLLARDRMGQKPLYYTVAGGLLIFASELTAVIRHPAVSTRLDMRSLSAYLALEYVPAPWSMISDVAKLEPASYLLLEGGESRIGKYWSLDFESRSTLRYPEAVQELREKLDASVRLRLVSDVPLGVFLSGGLDSSSVAALAAASGTIDTFSVGFRDSSFDESRFAREVAQRIGSRHHEMVLEGEEMPDLVPEMADVLDEPLGDASIVPTTLLSRFARGSVTVALGGDGGDELFAGYPMHQGHRVARLVRRIPPAVFGAIAAGAQRLPVSHRNFSLGFKITTFLRGASLSPPYNHAAWMSSFLPEEQSRLLTVEAWEAAEQGRYALDQFEAAWRASEGAQEGGRIRYLDAVGYLPGDVLTKVDRASMSVGLEVRAPFLDRGVVELAFSLPDEYHMRGLTGKRLLRDAMADALPIRVLRRPKKGFGIPVGRWLNGPLKELAWDLLGDEALRRAGLFRHQEVHRRLKEHHDGIRDHRKPLWTLLMFELWRRAAGIS